MTAELKRLAEAAKAKIEDGKPKSWWIYSIEEHEFAKAASPDAILALIEERDRLREALTAIAAISEDDWAVNHANRALEEAR